MIVPVRYSYVTWNPPSLTEEELALGEQIAARGRESFVLEFRKSISKKKDQAARQPAAPLRIFFAILFFIGCFAVIISAGMFPPLAVLIVFVAGIYLISMRFATRKFEKWVDRLIAKYAAHVAKGGHRKPPVL